MTDSERIKEIEKHTSLSTRALAAAINLKTAQTLYDIHKGKHGISKDVANKITGKYLNINLSWLLTGEGEMLRQDQHLSSTQETYYKADVRMPREVFDQLVEMTKAMTSQQETIASQQRTIESMNTKQQQGNAQEDDDAACADAV